jgi:hypothetical protein
VRFATLSVIGMPTINRLIHESSALSTMLMLLAFLVAFFLRLTTMPAVLALMLATFVLLALVSRHSDILRWAEPGSAHRLAQGIVREKNVGC